MAYTLIRLDDDGTGPPAAPPNARNVVFQGVPSNNNPQQINVSGWIPEATPSGAGHQGGLVPDPGSVAGTSKFLREDMTYVAPPTGGGGAVFTFDGDSLSGYTTSGTATAGVATSGYSPGDFNKALQVGAVPGSGYAYENTGLVGFAGMALEFDVAAIHDATYTIPLVHVIFGANATGVGPVFRLDGRGGGNFSGLAQAAAWNNSGGPSAGLNLTTDVWYHVRIVINAAGTQATCYINGQCVNQVAVTLSGTYIGFSASNGNAGGFVANVRVYQS